MRKVKDMEEKELTQKERIIVQTSKMFVEQGIKAVRMDDIARELGVSKRTLYELFSDKESLLYLSLNHHFNSIRDEHISLCQGAENIIDSIYFILSNNIDKGHVTSRLMTNLRKFYPKIHKQIIEEHSTNNRNNLREMILNGIEDGIFSDKFNIDLAIGVLYSSANTTQTSADLITPEDMSPKEVIVQIVTTFFRGLSTVKGLEMIDACLKKYNL